MCVCVYVCSLSVQMPFTNDCSNIILQVADNRDTLLQMAWSVAESKALARYIQVNTMQSSAAWSDCAAFLNTAFGTSRSGEIHT